MKRFTEQDVLELSKNKYVQKASIKSITYHKNFKELFLKEYYEGKQIRDIFSDAGFDVTILGKDRIHSASNRWREQIQKLGKLEDTRSSNSGRKPKTEKTLSKDEIIERQQAQIKFLKKELEHVKKQSNPEGWLIN